MISSNNENFNLIEMKSICKEFPGVVALVDVDFKVKEGEIRALVGENGAGKSTLVKILSGVYPANSYKGDVFINGKKLEGRYCLVKFRQQEKNWLFFKY